MIGRLGVATLLLATAFVVRADDPVIEEEENVIVLTKVRASCPIYPPVSLPYPNPSITN